MKKTILIVDDAPTYRAMMEATVKELGFETVVCDDGARAIPLLTKKHPMFSAVLLDVCMPLIDGISTLGHIRSNWPNLPVVIISGSNDSSDEKSATQLGILGFVRKPFQPDELSKSLEAILGREESSLLRAGGAQ